jgi:biotin synthase
MPAIMDRNKLFFINNSIFTAKLRIFYMITINNREDIIDLLRYPQEKEDELYRSAVDIRNKTIGNSVYLRGLIEISNSCEKDCLYCGIRKSNSNVQRYLLSDKDIIDSAVEAYEQKLGSIVLQAGERSDAAYVLRIEHLLKEIKKHTDERLGITLSLGEQTQDTYKRWLDSGAHRYLLRIETSNENLYKKIHPDTPLHSFHKRIECIERLKQCGYQTGSGVMIGLPFQTVPDLADDLLFLQRMDIDMVGMGPYLEHPDTPLYAHRNQLLSLPERLQLSLRMIATLRLLIPDVNIAATTALQTIDPLGREKGLMAGANVIMPNVTPAQDRRKYNLYQNKPFSEESTTEAIHHLAQSVERCGCRIAFGEWGDPQHKRRP